jgi:amino acid transporter
MIRGAMMETDRATACAVNGAPRTAAGKPLEPHELLSGERHHERLGPWLATAVCGNDITSSCLYVAAIATVYAHALAPLALLLVAGVLYLYRMVYTEVVEALPLNGGIYNCLLNSTRKFSAAVGACLTLLSYLATAVISAKTGVTYLETLLPAVPVMEATALVLALFAGLTILGITESARVALVIFLLNIATLALFVLWSLAAVAESGLAVLAANWSALQLQNRWLENLFLGFSAALLGVSGFESSANFVEEQRPGVFRQTLRNMWLAVTVFNPLIVLAALALLPVAEIIAAKDSLLSRLGYDVGGRFLHTLIVLDAFLVLSGAVLTSFVGVTGLIHRMTLDQCLPRFFLKSSRRGTQHRIILGFLALTVSILYLTGGNLLSLAGVYTISFLGVMTLFGVGNILLKVNRRELKRTFRAGWLTVVCAVCATTAGIVGNMVIDLDFLLYFAVYFVPAVFLVSLMYARIPILKAFLGLANELLEKIFIWRTVIIDKITDITDIRVVLFIRGGKLARLAKAFDYIVRNESSRKITAVHLFRDPCPQELQEIEESLAVMRELYPDLTIELISRPGQFNAETVEELSRELDVPKNYMFIGAPEAKHSFSIQDLGGVRVIF